MITKMVFADDCRTSSPYNNYFKKLYNNQTITLIIDSNKREERKLALDDDVYQNKISQRYHNLTLNL